METIKNIQTRRSIRQYRAFTMPKQDLQTILTAAMYAPSAMNKQPWEFFVIQESDLLQKITQVHPYADFATEAGTALLICQDKNTAFGEYGPIDVALAAQNIMLTAHDLGYGTCFCGVWPDTERMQAFAEAFDLPEQVEVIGLIVMGVPAVNPNMPDRFNPSKIHINKW